MTFILGGGKPDFNTQTTLQEADLTQFGEELVQEWAKVDAAKKKLREEEQRRKKEQNKPKVADLQPRKDTEQYIPPLKLFIQMLLALCLDVNLLIFEILCSVSDPRQTRFRRKNVQRGKRCCNSTATKWKPLTSMETLYLLKTWERQ